MVCEVLSMKTGLKHLSQTGRSPHEHELCVLCSKKWELQQEMGIAACRKLQPRSGVSHSVLAHCCLH